MNLQERNQQLRAWDRTHVWHSFTQMKHYQPFVVESAEGCWLRDIDGKRYLDAVSSLWCNILGHAHPRLNAAIETQLQKVAHVTNLGASNVATIELARKLVEISPQGLEHVFFCSDGANAIEVALKIAFQFWQQADYDGPPRTRYIALGDAYHGDTIGTVSVGDVPLFHQLFQPLLFEPIRLQAPDISQSPEGAASDLVADALAKLERVLKEKGHEIAAIILEPLVQGAAGIRIHPDGFLKGVAELARRYDVLMIADEVAVGFGRTGKLFACEWEGVSPDILCLGKGLSGGYLPISATLTTTKIFDAFLGDYKENRTFFHGHTFSGNPLASAVSLECIKVLQEEKIIERLPEKMDQITMRLKKLDDLSLVHRPRRRGMIAAFDLPLLENENATETGYRFCDLVLKRGVRIRPLGASIIIMPPLVISRKEIDQLFDAIEITLQESWRQEANSGAMKSDG